jgi:hypothetical protein
MHFSIKGCFKPLSARFTKQKIEDIAADIANQCRTTLSKQIIGKSKIMPPKQIHGYLRAYVSCSLESIINEREDIKQLDPRQISKVILQAKELLIGLVVSDMRSMSPKIVADMSAAA